MQVSLLTRHPRLLSCRARSLCDPSAGEQAPATGDPESPTAPDQEPKPPESKDTPPSAGWASASPAATQHDYLYTMRHVEDKAKQAVDNISTLTSFKSTILARTAVYDSPDGVRHSLEFFRRRFKWFDFDESNLKQSTTYYCCDQQGVHNVHLTGYLIMCHRIDGRYVFRSCVAEFYEQVTFDQLAYKVLASSTSIVGGIAASAANRGGDGVADGRLHVGNGVGGRRPCRGGGGHRRRGLRER